MEWIQRNPKKAVGLSALAVLVAVVLVWGMTGGSSGTPSAAPTLPGPTLASPTATPSHLLTALSSPSASAPPTGVGNLMKALASPGAGGSGFAAFGTGYSKSLSRHSVVITAESDGPMMAVGWWIPFADHARKGADTSKSKTFRHSDMTWGDKDVARILAYGGPYSRKTWCTVTVDGKVTERQEASGPYAEVFCQG